MPVQQSLNSNRIMKHKPNHQEQNMGHAEHQTLFLTDRCRN